MYKTILVTLDTSPADRAIVDHVKQLAKICGSSVVLLHVADGWAARQFGKDAVSTEIQDDTAYLRGMEKEFEEAGIPVTAELAYGDPRTEILRWVKEKGCSLIAMATDGHKFLGDLFLGATAVHVQHRVDVPMLLIRAKDAK